MDNKYKVKVNDDYDFSFTKAQISSLDSQETHPGKYHLLENHRSFKAEILQKDFYNKKYQIKINANIYEVAISNNLDMLIEKMGLSLGSALKMSDIKAPMPGLILDVNVKEGDEVKEGDYLLVLEAMKMENTLTAPGDGIIKSVKVEKGQTVDKNQLLIELE